MSKINVGVGDDFPLNESPQTEAHPCGRMASRWSARRAARRERWRQWCAYWHRPDGDAKAKPQGSDASYADVPPRDTTKE